MLCTMWETLKTYLYYRTSRQVRVDIWQVGLTYRILQLAVIAYVLWDLIVSNSYVVSEVPSGTVNAWCDTGRASFAALLAARNATSFAYCSSPDHDFMYSAEWSYVQPACRPLQPDEIVTKGVGSVHFTTNIIETIEYGWPCDDADADATKRGKCEEGGGSVEQSGNQCICALSTTFYPKGIEDLKLAFEHEYRSTDKLFNPILKGSSFNSAAEHKLDTVIKSAAALSVQPLMEPSLLTTITGH